jgi:hypothetical protein
VVVTRDFRVTKIRGGQQHVRVTDMIQARNHQGQFNQRPMAADCSEHTLNLEKT